MKLEDQVCSLELAKRLKELGVRQESLWFWCLPPMNLKTELLLRGVYRMYSLAEDVAFKKSTFGDDTEWYAAFTVAELLALIGEPIIVPVEGTADYLAEELIRRV